MLCFRRIAAAPAAVSRRHFFPFMGLGNLFEELNHGYTVGPRVAVKGAQDHVALEFDVPRFKADELKISTRNGTITVSGKKGEDPTAARRQLLFGDAPATTFTRTFQVPREFDLSQLKSELDHGVFTVTIPRSKPALPETPTTPPAAPATETPAAKEATNKLAVETKSTSPTLIENLSKMTWPPRVKIDDTAAEVKFSLALPQGVSQENLDLQLRGRQLHVGVHHTQQVEKKDPSGRVVFSESQSVSYSTPVQVPEGTRASDIATALENGELVITVAKQGTAQQTIKVK